MDRKPVIEIEYCTGCRWMLRGAWFAQEILSSFESDIEGVTLKPGGGAVFEIRINDTHVRSRVDDGGFPDIKLLKHRVCDVVAPGREMGHLDR